MRSGHPPTRPLKPRASTPHPPQFCQADCLPDPSDVFLFLQVRAPYACMHAWFGSLHAWIGSLHWQLHCRSRDYSIRRDWRCCAKPTQSTFTQPPLPHTHAHTNTTQDRGIGRDLALLYEAYATFLELKGTFPRADLVYQEGINRCVDPLHLRCAASLPCVLLQHLQGKLRAYPALAARASCAEC